MKKGEPIICEALLFFWFGAKKSREPILDIQKTATHQRAVVLENKIIPYTKLHRKECVIPYTKLHTKKKCHTLLFCI